jgi:hypothetical protein
MAKPPEIPSDVPFTLACFNCDADGPETYEAAVQQGWVDIKYDDGIGWNFLGICPDCRPKWESPPAPQT